MLFTTSLLALAGAPDRQHMFHDTHWQEAQIRHMRTALSLIHSLRQDEQKDVIVLETEI